MGFLIELVFFFWIKGGGEGERGIICTKSVDFLVKHVEIIAFMPFPSELCTISIYNKAKKYMIPYCCMLNPNNGFSLNIHKKTF